MMHHIQTPVADLGPPSLCDTASCMCQHILVDAEEFDRVDIIMVARKLTLHNLRGVGQRLLCYSMNAGMQNQAGVVFDFYPIVGMSGVFNFCDDCFSFADRGTVRRCVLCVSSNRCYATDCLSPADPVSHTGNC
jgi:hypothetical protein